MCVGDGDQRLFKNFRYNNEVYHGDSDSFQGPLESINYLTVDAGRHTSTPTFNKYLYRGTNSSE